MPSVPQRLVPQMVISDSCPAQVLTSFSCYHIFSRYYQMAFEKNRKIGEKMAALLHKRRLRSLMGRCFNAWRRSAREARAEKKGAVGGAEERQERQEREEQAGGDSDCIDIEYTVSGRNHQRTRPPLGRTRYEQLRYCPTQFVLSGGTIISPILLLSFSWCKMQR